MSRWANKCEGGNDDDNYRQSEASPPFQSDLLIPANEMNYDE